MNSSRGPRYLQPAILGGLVTGVLSALPVISAGNICCCLWVVTGGLLASYLLQQNHTEPITAGDGAIVGLLAGVFGAIVSFVLSIPISLIVGPVERQVLERLREVAGSSLPSNGPMGFGSGQGGIVGIILIAIAGFVFFLIVGSVVSTVAGVVGAALFAKPAPRPQTGDGA